jgi:hypothetical protein
VRSGGVRSINWGRKNENEISERSYQRERERDETRGRKEGKGT